ncbi:molybdopterin converting factor subunit 1 [Rheinheimera sp. MM224]|uniref:molybdopterin converting factor subunit 1 n=1 Tax=Rheinheimera sp. MM224 TaxID=3019969 RepID=UPI0021F88509|nr:molybdopterin converting factor subunit 1 [Rheinheimera sp. MM224]CAI3798353.1 Molybdopterin synthase sulfur carrier subunit [Rheinheimera sp. MM224]
MRTKILFFAQLRELLGCDQIELDLCESLDIRALINFIIQTHPSWQEHLQSSQLMCAVNQQLVGSDTLVKAGDEVAFFPPVTGG